MEPGQYDAAAAAAHAAWERLAAAQTVCMRFRHANPDVSHLTAAELDAMLRSESPPIIIDVRSRGEWNVSTIPGAIRLPGVDVVATRGRTLVCFCTVGMRSSLEARMLAKRHPECRVFSMDGVLCWSHHSGTLAIPGTSQPTGKLHVFSKQFAQMLPAEAERTAVWYSSASPGMAAAMCDVVQQLARSALHRVGIRS